MREPIEQRFAREIADHTMSVLHDDGLYRHLRFKRPDTLAYYFDIVTWPGYLAYTGDMGAYVFSRTTDMLTFFESESGRINPHYWSEKLQGEGRDLGREYSHHALRARVLAWADELEELDAFYDETPAYPSLVREALEREVLHGWTHDEHEGRERLELLEDLTGVRETWEWDLRDYELRFLWCCHALVWGIAQYRQATATEAA